MCRGVSEKDGCGVVGTRWWRDEEGVKATDSFPVPSVFVPAPNDDVGLSGKVNYAPSPFGPLPIGIRFFYPRE